MKKCFIDFLNVVVYKPWKVFLSGVLALLLISSGLQYLESDFSYRIWFRENNPKLQEFDAFERKFGSDELAVVVIHSPSGIFDRNSAEVMTDLTEDMWHVPEVIRVDSLTNYQWVHAEADDLVVEPLFPEDTVFTQSLLNARKEVAVNHRSIEGYLINKKGDTALIYASLKPALNGTPDYEKVALAMRETIAKYEGVGDHEFYLTGNPMINYAFQESTQQDMQKLVPFVLLLTIIFLWVNLRKLSAVILALVAVFSTIFSELGFAGWFGIKMNNLTAISPQYMIAIAIAVSVHILVTYFQFTKRVEDKKEALYLTVEKNFLPTLLTAVSTSIGFFSFLSAEIPAIMEMGFVSGVGTLFSWVWAYLIMVPLLSILPFRSKYSPNTKVDSTILTPSELALRVTDVLGRHKWKILITYSFLIVFSITQLTKIEVNSDPFDYFVDTYPLSIATDFIEENLGGAVGVEFVIDSGKPEGIKDPAFLKKVEAFQDWVSSHPKVTKTVSIIDILKEMNKSLHEGDEAYYALPESRDMVAQQLFLYTMNLPQGLDINNRMSIENDAIRLTAMWTLHKTKEALLALESFEKKAKEMGLDVQVTGKTPLYQSNNALVVKSFVFSISIAVVLICLLLIAGLRSVRIGLLSMIPNTIPIILTASLLPVLKVNLDIGTVIVASVCLGIAVDDTIHFLSNYRKYRLNGDSTRLAVAKVLTYTAPALIITTMVLVAAFATFAFGTFVPNQNFGKFVAITLSIALFVDLTLLPAILLKKKDIESK